MPKRFFTYQILIKNAKTFFMLGQVGFDIFFNFFFNEKMSGLTFSIKKKGFFSFFLTKKHQIRRF
jgi:hypothetical protein